MADFEQIYYRHFREVYRFVYSLSRDKGVSEEITQETFFKALKSIHGFKGNCKLSVWLCQIAKNTYFSYLDKQKRIAPEQADINAISGNLEEAMVKREETLRIHGALRRISEPYKEVFTLRVFGELSFSEIGGLFEKGEGWARVTFFRAKQKIQDLLKEEDEHEQDS
ncbi:RNA polymerase sigma factor [Paenibacillus sp. M1]|uniref:RNA polymerase sigma factor n=1 Tax=Paenibacillus haidiansis TaxID=1574488 RepID=A0ABU7VWI1_9BACL